ncbi:protein kinase [Bacillus sp. FJAT-26390]|uniref:protein kinase domain-containing protein n=1 Tax=Bacillus sp. FJAT-26390 TaxID=1743142 RepID=UPI000807A4ED|nr:protein kinase [Bacillus sp. FJAT-26390]OBZ13641.1 hypothetical protein A7975_12540 [Bacillus sp. FJAT-26390]
MYELQSGQLNIEGNIISIPNVIFVKELGKGKNGLCFEGQSEFPKRKVVIKIWLPRRDISIPDEERFKEEVNKTAMFNSERIVQVYNAGVVNEIFYAVMEYIEGKTLKDWLLYEKPPFEHRRNALQSLLAGVRLANNEKITLGDLHWENVMILNNNTSKIIDIGTSVYANSAKASHERSKRLLLETSLKLLQEEGEFKLLDLSNLIKCPKHIMIHCLEGLKDTISYIHGYGVLDYQLDEVMFIVSDIVTKYPLFDLENVINRFYATDAYKYQTDVMIYLVKNECYKLLDMPMSVEFGESITPAYISETIENYETVKRNYIMKISD